MDDIWGAAGAGDLAEVQRLVGQDPGLLNAKGSNTWTPLVRAAEGGHVAVVRWLVDQGSALDERGVDRNTALCLASSRGRTPVVRLLLERGAHPAIANIFGWTPLRQASSEGHLETVRCLLSHPSAAATINHRDMWDRTALSWACEKGRVDAVRALLERGADPTIADHQRRTPMAMAKRNNHPACVEALKVRCYSLPSSSSADPAD
jgi:ankyrin repeat protein